MNEEQWQQIVLRVFAEIGKLAPATRVEALLHLLERTQDPFIRLNAKVCLYDALCELIAPIENEPPKRVRWLAEIGAVRLLPPALWERLFRFWGLEPLLRDALATGDTFATEHLTAMLLKDVKSKLAIWFHSEGLPFDLQAGDVLEAICEAGDSLTARVRRAVLRRLRPTNPKKECEESQLALPEGSPSPLERAVAAEPTPEEALVEAEESTPDLSQLLASLSEEDRLLLATITGEHTEEEVADLLGVSVSALRKRRQRLIRNLRERLAV